MPIANNKRIEESATSALKTSLLKCGFIDSYIDTNDKTPSWDGTVFVYTDLRQKKEDLLGRVPIQVKGTGNRIISDQASYSCEMADLKNYYNDGGCIFFLVSVDPSDGWNKIYYVSLLTYDLADILKKAGNQKSYTIHLKTFPSDNANEIANLFMSFVDNMRKQMSFIGKDILSLEELQEKGLLIDQLSFSTSGVGVERSDLEKHISTHDFYLYAHIKGLDVDIPVDKITNAVVSRKVNGAVAIKNTEYYPSYNVIFDKGIPFLQIGKGIKIVLPSIGETGNMEYRPTGTLSDFIHDASCYIAIIENKEITLNGIRIPFNNLNDINLEEYHHSLSYFKDVKKMLDILGVTEELDCAQIREIDEKNIRNFVKATLYGKKVGFFGVDAPVIHGPFTIANLVIQIWATKQKNGMYSLGSFFEDHPIAMFAADDTELKNPMTATQYLLLKENDFVHTSNMDYDKIIEGIIKSHNAKLVIDHTILLLLRMLKGYDMQENKDERLLELAEKTCQWIVATDSSADADNMLLNRMQIVKRKRELNIDEIIMLAELIKKDKHASIRCGAYLLLGNNSKAQSCFNELESWMQKEFLTYPICIFGQLEKTEA